MNSVGLIPLDKSNSCTSRDSFNESSNVIDRYLLMECPHELNNTNSMLAFGCRDNNGNFAFAPAGYSKAYMDDVRVYNVALTAADVAAIYGGE